MNGGRRWRLGLVCLVGAVALIAAGCYPMNHSSLTVVTQPGSGVDFVLLSGDGNFAVVTTPTGPERVDRRDNSMVALPAGTPSAISRDGSRVLLTSATPVVWSDGVVITPPPGAHMSRDLTYGVFVDTDGTVKTWETATQTVTSVETIFPRPPPWTGVQAEDISNDGQTVEYSFLPGRFVRFVNLTTHQLYDTSVPLTSGTDAIALAPSGTAFLRTHFEATSLDTFNSYAELRTLPSGTLVREFTTGSSTLISGAVIADTGNVAWVFGEEYTLCMPFPPITTTCRVGSVAVAIMPGGFRSTEMGPVAPPLALDPGGLAASSDGRFLLITAEEGTQVIPPPTNPQSVVVVDLYDPVANHSQSLDGSATSRFGQISDDYTVIATTTTNGGWYEFTPSSP